MPTNQFRMFSSGDVGSPQLNGLSGSLINVLTWCLVTGSGWLQPSASVLNISNAPIIAIYKQPSGSGCTLYINDGGPNATAVGKEAWATGWENVSTMSVPCGTGSNQFPKFGQLLTSGHYVIRKNSVATNVPVNWTMYVDDRTFYFFTLPEDTHTYYSTFFFGDFYSTNPSVDTNTCFIEGRTSENVGAASSQEQTDIITYLMAAGGATTGASGMAAKTYGGLSTAAWIGKLGDFTKTGETSPSSYYHEMTGIMPTPNPFQNDIIITPLLVWEPGKCIRGRYRGLYYLPHPISQFYDGQILSGSNEQYGKIFQLVKCGQNAGMWAVEISNTLETN
jgi:hypothetical protein